MIRGVAGFGVNIERVSISIDKLIVEMIISGGLD
jgi:hypothetical protein